MGDASGDAIAFGRVLLTTPSRACEGPSILWLVCLRCSGASRFQHLGAAISVRPTRGAVVSYPVCAAALRVGPSRGRRAQVGLVCARIPAPGHIRYVIPIIGFVPSQKGAERPTSISNPEPFSFSMAAIFEVKGGLNLKGGTEDPKWCVRERCTRTSSWRTQRAHNLPRAPGRGHMSTEPSPTVMNMTGTPRTVLRGAECQPPVFHTPARTPAERGRGSGTGDHGRLPDQCLSASNPRPPACVARGLGCLLLQRSGLARTPFRGWQLVCAFGVAVIVARRK